MEASAAVTISLSEDLEDYVSSKMASGSYRSVTEVIQESLRFLEQHESLLETPDSELREQIEVGFSQAERGELLDGEEVFRELEARLESAPGS